MLRFYGALCIVIICGCDPGSQGHDDVYTGTIETVDARPVNAASLYVAYGKHWPLGGVTMVNVDGRFQIPSEARVAVVFVDGSRDGAFDRFAEPSGDCRLLGREWRCSLALQRTTLHRAITTRNSERHDSTYLVREDFLPDGKRTPGSSLCVGSRCAQLNNGPFMKHSDAPIESMSLCGEEGFPPQDAQITSGELKATVKIVQPRALEVSANVERLSQDDGGLRLYFSTPRVDRVLLWAGRVNRESGAIQQLYWTSEQAGVDIAVNQQDVVASVSKQRIDMCLRDPNCEVVAQLLRYWSQPDAALVEATEFRTTIDFRRHL